MSNTSTMAKPPFDPGFSDALAAVAIPGGLTREMIPMMRQKVTQMDTLEHALSLYPAMTHEETTIPGPYGSITLSIFRPANKLPEGNPGLYHIHGGGMVVGNRFLGMPTVC
jgi:acetyl esterase/lipase